VTRSYLLLFAFLPALLALAPPAQAEKARVPLVAVVFGRHSYESSPQGEGAGARTYAETVQKALDTVGIRYTVLDDVAAETGGLLAYPVAIFPYNFEVPQAEQEAVLTYLDSGGKVIFCYAIPGTIASRLGFSLQERVEGKYETLRLDQNLLPGAPERVLQGSWGVMPIIIQDAHARVVGEWVGPEGHEMGAGLVLSPKGAYLGHVLTEPDLENKGMLLFSLLAALVPEFPERAGDDLLGMAENTLQQMATRVASRSDAAARARGETFLEQARARIAEARRLTRERRPMQALQVSREAVRLAERAAAAAAPERTDEFRAVWLHDAYGVPGWGWERTVKTLKEHSFNALIVNQLWAGLGHYQSKILPVSPRVASEGDQIAEAARWCRRYGIELHVWKVNHNLLTAPREFVDKLRAEGRLQRHRDGSEVEWLCPSDPCNFALERDSMLEVVRNYDIAGIHFDYIRYPHELACYCEGCHARFEVDTGTKVAKWPEEVTQEPRQEQFQVWRREQVTRLVRAVSTEAHRIRPGIKVSAAVFTWPWNYEVGQAWDKWIDDGLLDFICPMNYTTSTDELRRAVTAEMEVVKRRLPLYIGLGEFLLPKTPDLTDQILLSRELGADGYVLFCYETLGPNSERLADLQLSLTAHPSTPR
jgi:uncharacterized lipoprotein YddW (UPF0748 family)